MMGYDGGRERKHVVNRERYAGKVIESLSHFVELVDRSRRGVGGEEEGVGWLKIVCHKISIDRFARVFARSNGCCYILINPE